WRRTVAPDSPAPVNCTEMACDWPVAPLIDPVIGSRTLPRPEREILVSVEVALLLAQLPAGRVPVWLVVVDMRSAEVAVLALVMLSLDSPGRCRRLGAVGGDRESDSAAVESGTKLTGLGLGRPERSCVACTEVKGAAAPGAPAVPGAKGGPLRGLVLMT